MTFFNPAQTQSMLNSPYYAQMMQQLQGSGSLQPPNAQMPNMAPQLPMATPQQGAGQPPMGQQAPQSQPGFFQQMMGSPQGMVNGFSGLSSLYGMGSGAMNGIGSLIGTSAGTPMAGAMGATQGSGLMGAATGGSTGIGWLDSLLAL